jgi:flagellar biogenesis protein FliO
MRNNVLREVINDGEAYHLRLNAAMENIVIRRKYLVLFLWIFFLYGINTYCFAEVGIQEEKQSNTVSELDNIGVKSPINFPGIISLLKSTGIIIVIIIVSVYFLRKKLGIKTNISKKKRYIYIVDTAPLGSKRHIHLVKIPGKLVLVGATNDRIQSLSEITEKDIVESVDTTTQGGDFIGLFKRARMEQT